jgi:hypothetical protein
MKRGVKTQIGAWSGVAPIVIGILVFGSIWGLIEVALGGGLRAAHSPHSSALLVGIGMGAVCGMALAIYKKPAMLIGIGIVAAAIKLLAVPISGVAVTCPANSCLAVALEAVGLSAVAFGLMKAMDRNVHAQIGAGAFGAFTGSVLFWLIGMHVAPCRYLLSFAGAPGTWMVSEGFVWAAFSAVLLPVGYWAGLKLRPKVAYMLTTKPRISYASSAAVFAFLLGMSAVALAAGL